jgi:IS5 family transposase
VSDKATGQILATAFAPGATHDFALFKSSRLWLDPETTVLADSGYQGITKWHRHSRTPHKNTKLHPLTSEKKQANARLASQRVSCEHLLGDLKRFAILRGPYRNH